MWGTMEQIIIVVVSRRRGSYASGFLSVSRNFSRKKCRGCDIFSKKVAGNFWWGKQGGPALYWHKFSYFDKLSFTIPGSYLSLHCLQNTQTVQNCVIYVAVFFIAQFTAEFLLTLQKRWIFLDDNILKNL